MPSGKGVVVEVAWCWNRRCEAGDQRVRSVASTDLTLGTVSPCCPVGRLLAV